MAAGSGYLFLPRSLRTAAVTHSHGMTEYPEQSNVPQVLKPEALTANLRPSYFLGLTQAPADDGAQPAGRTPGKNSPSWSTRAILLFRANLLEIQAPFAAPSYHEREPPSISPVKVKAR